MISSITLRQTSNVYGSVFGGARLSATEWTFSRETVVPASKLKLIVFAPSGSTPYITMSGQICFSAAPKPAANPPPPTGRIIASN